MSNRKHETTVTLVCSLFILAYYLVNIFQMLQSGGLNSADVFRLWIVVIVANIVLTIAGFIISYIVINIVHAIKTQKEEEVRMLEDERDRLIGLKGDRVSYIVFSIGVFISMLTFALGQDPLVMFSLIVFFSLLAEITGKSSQLVFYSRGA